MKKGFIKGIIALGLCVGLSNSITALAVDKVNLDDGPIRCFADEKSNTDSQKVDEKKDEKDKKANAEEKKDEKDKKTSAEEKKDEKDKKTSVEDKKDEKDKKTNVEDKKEEKAKKTNAEEKKDEKNKKATLEEKKDEKDKKANVEDKKENKKDAKETDSKKEEESDKAKKTNVEEKSQKDEKIQKEDKSEKKTKKLDTKETTIEMIEELEEALAPCKRYSVGDFWSEENEKLLTEEQRIKIKEFREKNAKGENLSLDEVEILKEYRIAVIKSKLGEEKFAEYEKLMERRDGDRELTLEERAKLYEFNKEIMGKK